ncbi:MAG: BON domain-containing protein [Planctomycetota bacterium]|nr:BON domain-containing protein [Planctomycetota bacterium]
MLPTNGTESESGDAREKRTRHCDTADLEAAVRRKILASPYVELRRMGCEYRNGVLTLRGRVTSYYLKQLAQTLAMQMEGVQMVNNRLVVAEVAVDRTDGAA